MRFGWTGGSADLLPRQPANARPATAVDRRVCQTHFGPVEDLERLAADLHTAIDEIVAIARRYATAPDRRARIEADMYAFVDARLDAHGCTLDAAGRHAIVDDDIRLNAAGLEVWLDRH